MVGRGTPPPVELTADEAHQSDAGLGLARIDEQTRLALGIESGAVLEIVGKRSTVASVRALPREDEGREVIRIDALVRRNAKIGLGDRVRVRRAEVEPAQQVAFAPIVEEGHRMYFGGGIEDFIKRGLQGRPLRTGDVVIVAGIALIGGPLPFMVVRTEPEGSVQVVQSTVLELREQTFREIDLSPPEDRLKEIVDRTFLTLSKLKGELEREMMQIEGETGERARSLRDRIQAFLQDLRGNENP